jgi:putative membrane protein
MSSDAYKDFSGLSEKHQVSMNRMKDLSGTRFDREYLSAQITLHRQNIQLFEGEAAGAQHPLLKQYAAKRLPVLRKHLQEATRIHKSLAGTPANDGRK